MKLIAIRRDDRFSPNSVEKDRLILEAACNNVCRHFEQQGEPCALRWIDEAELTTHDDADLYLSMARLPEALTILEGFEQQGRRVINSPRGVRNCQRSVLEKLMRENNLSTPTAYQEGPEEDSPCWLKRGDAAAQSKDDVVFCNDAEALKKAISDFEARGISDYVISRHVEGDVVKFYGVNSLPFGATGATGVFRAATGVAAAPPRGANPSFATEDFRAATDVAAAPQRGANPAFATEEGPGIGSSFFRHFYPTDDGQTKFGDETARNGEAHHYAFDVSALQSEVERLAQLVGIEVYGGDAIIDRKGRFYIIDFNDWPSFSRCRDEAAEAIANCPLK